MTKVLKMALMGRLQLELGRSPLTQLVSGKAQALLCYLAVTGRPHSRQALAGLLWGDMPESDARRNLRGVVMKLRQSVETHLIVTHQTLAFNRDSDYWLDVETFRANLAHRAGVAVSPNSLREAVALYRGDFLEDLYVRQAPAFEEWVTRQRTQLRQSLLDICYALAAHYAEQGEYGAGIKYARRLLDMDPVREDGQRQLMLLLALSGQRSAALSQYELCCKVLTAELGIEPSVETAVLYQRIRAGEIVASVPSRSQTSPLAPLAAELPPFIAGPPVTHPRHFFGRERELKRLFNLLKRLPLQNAAIIGSRRSGKTSLLHYLKTITTAAPEQLRSDQRADWLAQPAHYRWIFVDFQDPRLGEREALLRHLLAHMELPVPEPCDLERFLDVVGDGLQTPTVVLFDEIGVALQRYPDLDDAFWESLRSLATNQVGGNLGFVLASAQSPDELAQHSGLGSPFFNIFGYTAVLGPLPEPEARQLIASSPRPFSEADVAWILAQSQCWPILLQILCRERLLALEDGELDDAWREDALRQMAPFKRVLSQG